MAGQHVPMRYPRKRLDLSLADVGYGLAACLRPGGRGDATARLARAWHPSEAVVACLSVRSGFDLLLASVDWPEGAEVLLSAVTVPHMAALVRHHGYRPIAIDVNPATMEVAPEAVRAACSSRTRAVVFAHLFGTRADVSALAEVARASGLLFIEDRAQCYDGESRSLDQADVALYSFGTIKTATCLGGGVALVRDPGLADQMRSRQRTWPRQPGLSYAGKLGKGALLLGLGHPRVYPRFTRLLEAWTGDYDAVVRSVSRGFTDDTLLTQIRQQPSTALLAVMAHRVWTYDPARVAARRAAGARLAAALEREIHLGGAGRGHTHWLFPVRSRAPAALVAAGRAAGFDLTCGSSTLTALDERCSWASEAMRDVVYLPAYGGMPPAALAELAGIVADVQGSGAKGGTRRALSVG